MKITISITKFRFEFSLVSVLLYLALIALLVSLGFWQLGRAEEKRIFIEMHRQSSNKDAVGLQLLIDQGLKGVRYRKIKMNGIYDQEHQFLIDNQILNGQPGYFVMTPFKIEKTDKAVLVNRGWIALIKDRHILPDISMAKVKESIEGRINHFPVVGIRLAGAEVPTEGWPSVVQVIDATVLAKKLKYSLLPFQIELDSEMNDGYRREWKVNTIMSPEKHVAYAVQWFGLALTLTVLFIGFSRKK